MGRFVPVSEEKRLITIEDVTKIKQVEEPRISPDGQWIAYVLQTPNTLKKGYDTNIYVVATSGGEPLQVTRSGKDYSPVWSPDSSQLAFVSTRDEKPQIYILPMNSPGEPRALTTHANGAFAPAWSPDGKTMAYLSRMNSTELEDEDNGKKPEAPKDELEGKHRKERKSEDEKKRFDPREIERIPYRQGTSFMDDRESHIYLMSTAEELKDDAAKPRRLTNANTSYSPPQWSKSGRHLVTTRSWNPEADENWQYSNIYLIEVESGVERRLKDDGFSYFAAIPSYDGDWLVCVRTPVGSTDALTRLTVVPLEGSGDFVDLNMEYSRPPADFNWLEDGTIMATMLTTGRVEVHKIDPKTKTFTPVVSDEQSIWVADFSQSGDVAYVSCATMGHIDELFYKPADDAPRQMTNANTEFLNEVQVMETHDFWFKNPQGQDIQGWYILPPNFEQGKKYPLALNIHGGPHVMWTPSHRAMWHEWQVHAAAGYVVFFTNPRGSDGYGQEHMAAIHGNWGKVTMDDIMAGVDALIAEGFIDESRMAITGGSFGGYMTAWIIGHSDRFASAVSQRGVYNIASFYGTSDVPILMSSEFDAEPWQDYAKYWQHSPLAYAHNIKTPTLIIHSENDFRVPISDGEQLFAWIRRATDTPVKMVRFPREGHELSRSGEPQHRIQRLTEMVNWFDKYCQPEKAQQPEPVTESADDDD
jgi:dipeptidyl aminopeptidase/acylaminoacyl peptidase